MVDNEFIPKNEDVIEFFKQKQLEESCGILCFEEDVKYLNTNNVLTFGTVDDEDKQAHELFDKLRRFDSMNVSKIYARLPSDKGIGLAVYNRLIRAAGFSIINLNNSN